MATRLNSLPDHFAETAVLVRRAAGTRSDWGELLPGAEITESVTVATWPVTEARNETEAASRLYLGRNFLINTNSRTKVQPLRSGGEGDIIRYRGVDYRVSDVFDYSEEGFIQARAWRDQ